MIAEHQQRQAQAGASLKFIHITDQEPHTLADLGLNREPFRTFHQETQPRPPIVHLERTMTTEAKLPTLAFTTTHHKVWGEVTYWEIEDGLLRASFNDGREYVVPIDRVTLIRTVPHGHENWGKHL